MNKRKKIIVDKKPIIFKMRALEQEYNRLKENLELRETEVLEWQDKYNEFKEESDKNSWYLLVAGLFIGLIVTLIF